VKAELTTAMTELGRDPKARFIGYGLTVGKEKSTFSGVPSSSIVETTVAENLMTGIAIGLSLKGYKPLVYFERFDFVLNALDAIVNHLDKMSAISDGQFRPACIFRIVVGNRHKPRFTGPTHTQDFSDALRHMVNFPVVPLLDRSGVVKAYAEAKRALDCGYSTALIEYKDHL
jgi:pyruvate/2-oxoglutarate/acetoin dehydrogenase E1 component